jgi:hypothetical protein
MKIPHLVEDSKFCEHSKDDMVEASGHRAKASRGHSRDASGI